MVKEVKKTRKKPAAKPAETNQHTKKRANTKAGQTSKIRQPLPNSFKLTVQVVRIFRQHWKTLGGIAGVYLILNVVFASGISNVNTSFASIKNDLDTSGGHGIARAADGFASLIGSSGSGGSGTGATLQSLLFIFESLVIIWALRHLLSGQQIGVKQAYYNAMTPLVPFLLVIGVILAQLLPVTIGALLLILLVGTVVTSSTAAAVISAVLFAGLAIWSLYMVTASIFAAYIVTLPEMHPRQALRSAKELVHNRRLKISIRLLFLPFVIYLAMGAVIVPLILTATFLVPTVFYVLAMLAIMFIHTYVYSLYRSLIE